MSTPDDTITVYAAALDGALKALPAAERDDIVREARAHLEFSAGAGRLGETLAAFGAPQAYALRFLDDPPGAQPAQRGFWTAAGSMAGSAVLALLTAAFVTVAVIDILVPAFGIWVNPASGAVYFGFAGMTTRAQELAGAWLAGLSVLAAFATAVLSFVTARAALRELRRYLKASTGARQAERAF